MLDERNNGDPLHEDDWDDEITPSLRRGEIQDKELEGMLNDGYNRALIQDLRNMQADFDAARTPADREALLNEIIQMQDLSLRDNINSLFADGNHPDEEQYRKVLETEEALYRAAGMTFHRDFVLRNQAARAQVEIKNLQDEIAAETEKGWFQPVDYFARKGDENFGKTKRRETNAFTGSPQEKSIQSKIANLSQSLCWVQSSLNAGEVIPDGTTRSALDGSRMSVLPRRDQPQSPN